MNAKYRVTYNPNRFFPYHIYVQSSLFGMSFWKRVDMTSFSDLVQRRIDDHIALNAGKGVTFYDAKGKQIRE